ncbi:hypothetical protein [Candidatus Uabimicrobium amorphum]|uniref:Major facilitator superfamily (MFS) profile domain-containing protein n=1 Tax=Uabimicrobium amorphum TaxID=2596890 RepID=A0A5S9IR44_UABAM|nr:hypothetical protein [Candidatus Uabimicrobium amorphum]BBM86568.1 hypothetical protein UABAM_04954 [Candidatus Uabimicrobium amorphum]
MQNNTDNFQPLKETRNLYFFIRIVEYLEVGFFWFLISIVSLILNSDTLQTQYNIRNFIFSITLVMFSNAFWEVITGWYADKFKRKYSIVAGFISCICGWIIIGLSILLNNHLLWTVGLIVWSLYPALVSGARDAWFVDRCNYYLQSFDLRDFQEKTFKISNIVGLIVAPFSALICWSIFEMWGLSINVSQIIPGALSCILIIISFCCIAVYRVTRKVQEEYHEHISYKINDSMVSFIKEGVKYSTTKPYKWFVLAHIGGVGFLYMWSFTCWPFILQLQEPGFFIFNKFYIFIFILISILGGINGLLLSAMGRYISKRKLLLILSSWYMLPLTFIAPICRYYGFSLFDANGEFKAALFFFAAFMFRSTYAAFYGILISEGNNLIVSKNKKKRALLSSLASAYTAAVFGIMGAVLLYFIELKTLLNTIGFMWTYFGCFFFLISVYGTYSIFKGQSNVSTT